MSNVLEEDRSIDPQPDEKVIQIHDDGILNDLPASYRVDKIDIQLPRPEKQFFSQELNVRRLHRIMQWLWLCGQTAPPRPLHHQLLMDRRIVITERLDFHLVWGNNRIFLKPLPRWLIHRDFWEQQLVGDDDEDPEPVALSAPGAGGSIRSLKSVALGFLLSYVALIQHESDFEIAKDARIIPKELSWMKWKLLVREILHGRRERLHRQVADRFIYGELRLHRLNLIYQCHGFSMKGYIPRWNSYKGFIQENLDVIVAGTVYVVLVLTAMQVGLATTMLEGNASFQGAAYGAAVFAMLGPLVAVALVLLFSMLDFGRNWAWNRRNEKKTQNILGRTWR